MTRPRNPADAAEAHYDSVSPAWRFLMGESFHYGYFESADQDLAGATLALTRRMAAQAELEASHHVLDVGCGVGGPARCLAREFGCRVTGISTSEVGVRLAREETAAEDLGERVGFEVRDAVRTGFPDEHFDRIWVMESSHLMPDKPAMLREAVRVLRPGGRLLLCDIVLQRDLPIAEVIEHAHAFDLLRRVFGRAKMETLLRYRGWLEDLGLRDVRTEDSSRQVAPTFDRWQQNADRHRERVVASIGEAAWNDFREACDTLRVMWGDALLGYGLVRADKPL